MRLLVFVVLLSLTTQVWGQSADALYEEALTQVAQKDFLRADQTLDQLIARYPNRKYDLASAYLLKSQVALQLQQYDAALEFTAESLRIREGLGSDDLASNLHQEALIYVAQGHLAKAIQIWDKAESLPFESAELVTQIYLEKSKVFLRLQKPNYALDYADQAQAIFEIEGVEDAQFLAMSYWLKAKAYLQFGEGDKAEPLLNSAILHLNPVKETDALLAARCFIHLASLQENSIQTQSLTHAHQILTPLLNAKNEQAVAILLEIIDLMETPIAQLNGQVLSDQAILALFPKTDGMSSLSDLKDQLPTNLLLLGKAQAVKAGEQNELNMLGLAMDNIRRHAISQPHEVSSMLESGGWQAIFAQAVNLSVNSGDTAKALEYASRWKDFSQLLYRIKNWPTLAPNLRLAYQKSTLYGAQYRATPKNERYAAQAKSALKEVEAGIKRLSKDKKNDLIPSFTFDLKAVQANLEDRFAILLYAGTNIAQWGFAIRKDGIQGEQLQLEDLEAFHALLSETSGDDYQAGAFAWYQALINPFQELLEDVQVLHIIPEASMGLIPFEALVTEVKTGRSFRKLDYLLEEYKISYGLNLPTAPIASKLPKVGLQIFEPSVNPQQLPEAIAPFYDSTYQLYPALRKGFKSGINTEAAINQQLIDRFDQKGRSVWTLYEAAATSKELLKAGASSDRVLHFAGPVISIGQAEQIAGALTLSQDETLDFDGFRDPAFSWNNTIISFSRLLMPMTLKDAQPLLHQFFSKGANYLLVPFQEEGQALLYDQFYRNVLKGRTPQAALVRAKQKLMKEERTAAPKYWATYLLFR